MPARLGPTKKIHSLELVRVSQIAGVALNLVNDKGARYTDFHRADNTSRFLLADSLCLQLRL